MLVAVALEKVPRLWFQARHGLGKRWMIRLFVAIDLPDLMRQELAGLGFGLPGARWVAAEQIHLTLRFIGGVDGAMFRDIREELAGIRSAPFAMQVKGLGCFPLRQAPRVLWAGVANNDALILLRNRVEAALVRCGLEPEGRKFAAHITLARLRDTPLSRLTNFLAGNALFSTEPVTVTEFLLYSSRITAKGAIHQLEASYPLVVG
jgi:2'-5' RNA ligase